VGLCVFSVENRSKPSGGTPWGGGSKGLGLKDISSPPLPPSPPKKIASRKVRIHVTAALSHEAHKGVTDPWPGEWHIHPFLGGAGACDLVGVLRMRGARGDSNLPFPHAESSFSHRMWSYARESRPGAKRR
jgi:hypothetical protein